MKTCLPRALRMAFPWLTIVAVALLTPACIATTSDGSVDNEEPIDETSQPLDAVGDGDAGDAGNPNGNCTTPECLKLGGARQ